MDNLPKNNRVSKMYPDGRTCHWCLNLERLQQPFGQARCRVLKSKILDVDVNPAACFLQKNDDEKKVSGYYVPEGRKCARCPE